MSLCSGKLLWPLFHVSTFYGLNDKSVHQEHNQKMNNWVAGLFHKELSRCNTVKSVCPLALATLYLQDR